MDPSTAGHLLDRSIEAMERNRFISSAQLEELLHGKNYRPRCECSESIKASYRREDIKLVALLIALSVPAAIFVTALAVCAW